MNDPKTDEIMSGILFEAANRARKAQEAIDAMGFGPPIPVDVTKTELIEALREEASFLDTYDGDPVEYKIAYAFRRLADNLEAGRG